MVINPIQYSDTGSYTVDVTDTTGTTTSSAATLTVNTPVAGAVDFTFDPGSSVNSTVDSQTVQSDGKVLIGGNFVTVNRAARGYVARLNADGSTDLTFGNGLAGANSFWGSPEATVLVCKLKLVIFEEAVHEDDEFAHAGG